MTEPATTTAIRVHLPTHLRKLAHIDDGELTLDVPGTATLGAVLDVLERDYPVLTGTIRHHGTDRRRAFIRFFACEEDLSHEPHDTPLPEPVVRGTEPLLIIGAMAGG